MSRRLTIVVTTPPDTGDLDTAMALARSAADSGVEVAVFVMSDAVAGLPERRDATATLDDVGCTLIACAHSAHLRSLSESDVGVVLGSQDDHAALVHRADRVVAFS